MEIVDFFAVIDTVELHVIEKRKMNTGIKTRFQMFMTKFKVKFPERGASLPLWLVVGLIGWLV